MEYNIDKSRGLEDYKRILEFENLDNVLELVDNHDFRNKNINNYDVKNKIRKCVKKVRNNWGELKHDYEMTDMYWGPLDEAKFYVDVIGYCFKGFSENKEDLEILWSEIYEIVHDKKIKVEIKENCFNFKEVEKNE